MFPSYITHASLTAICCVLCLWSAIYSSVYFSHYTGNLGGLGWRFVLSSLVPARMLNTLFHSLAFCNAKYSGQAALLSRKPVKSFSKGDLIKSWGNIGIGWKEMGSKTLVEMNNNKIQQQESWRVFFFNWILLHVS